MTGYLLKCGSPFNMGCDKTSVKTYEMMLTCTLGNGGIQSICSVIEKNNTNRCTQASFLLKQLLYLPIQMHFAISNSLGRTKLTNSFEKQPLKLSSCMWWGCAPWNCGKFVRQPASSKQFSCSFFFIFELEGITKHLITGPAGNSESCFPSTSMLPSGDR